MIVYCLMDCPDGLWAVLMDCLARVYCFVKPFRFANPLHTCTYNSTKLVRVSDTRVTAHVCLKQPSLKQMLHLHSCKISVETVSTMFPMLLSEGRGRVRCALARHYQKTDENETDVGDNSREFKDFRGKSKYNRMFAA